MARDILDLPILNDLEYPHEYCRRRDIPIATCKKTGDRYVKHNGHRCIVTDKFNGYIVDGPIPKLKSGRD